MKSLRTSLFFLGAIALLAIVQQVNIHRARRADAMRLCYGWNENTEPTREWCVNKYMEYYK